MKCVCCLLACAVVLALGGCTGSKRAAEPPEVSSSARPAQRVKTELYFGLAKPGGQITAEEWREFMGTVITPRFPAGLTVYDASGQWRGGSGQGVKEATKVLVAIHEGTAACERAIEEIRAEYKKRFQQESVLRADMKVEASY
ncbi:MAG: DUF3574 domain-containing protein [Planctomycetota bacterium]|nr:DUF3574 domain-containing protein [Planctomycetota bacterium]